jgi:hypothetical protein
VANVNLPPLKIPQKFLQDRESADYLDRLNFIIFQLWKRTGGGGDTIENNVTNITDNTTNIAINTADIAAIEDGVPEIPFNPELFQLSFYESVQNSNYQTFSNEIIKLSADVTITLNPYPQDSERVYIKSATGKGFSIASNRKIDGNTSIRFNNPYSGYWFSYSIELDTWSIL